MNLPGVEADIHLLRNINVEADRRGQRKLGKVIVSDFHHLAESNDDLPPSFDGRHREVGFPHLYGMLFVLTDDDMSWNFTANSFS